MCRIMFANIKKKYRYYRDYTNEMELKDNLIKYRNIITHARWEHITVVPLQCEYEDDYYAVIIDTVMNHILSHIGMDWVMYYLSFPLYTDTKGDK